MLARLAAFGKRGAVMEVTADNCSLKLGEKAPYFSLKGVDGRIYSLNDFKENKALVVIFTCNHCPYAQAYEQRLIELEKRFAPEGVAFVAINANDAEAYPEDSFENMIQRAEKLSLPYPYLHDEKQITAKAFDANCTPEIYVFDENSVLRFHGRVDDNYAEPHKVSQHNLRDALEALVADKPVEIALTHVIGCSIKWRN